MSRAPRFSVLFIFADGFGLGSELAESNDNPFFQADIPFLQKLFGFIPSLSHQHAQTAEALLLPLDATLGVKGFPLSGTGQATLLTGINCSQINGAHFGPYPPSSVREILNEKNIFRVCARQSLPFAFVNAYPQRYFDYLESHPLMTPAIASSYLSTGRALHRVEEIADGVALSADITAERWGELGYQNIPHFTPHEAGARLAVIAQEHSFTMFEYFATDKAGHKQDMQAACVALEKLDGLLAGAYDACDPEKMLIVLTSDHGNMEDLTTGSHTFNPVPIIAIGAARNIFLGARSLADVAPAIISLLMN